MTINLMNFVLIAGTATAITIMALLAKVRIQGFGEFLTMAAGLTVAIIVVIGWLGGPFSGMAAVVSGMILYALIIWLKR